MGAVLKVERASESPGGLGNIGFWPLFQILIQKV